MSGFTKHQSTVFLNKKKKDFEQYIEQMISLLPKNYTFDTIVTLLKKYYPYELQQFIEGFEYYKLKDRKLLAIGKKIRHKIPEPILILKELSLTKKILDSKFLESYGKKFNKDLHKVNIMKLDNKRQPKINRIKSKIDNSKKKAQLVEPLFLDKLIGLYERKTTSQKDKVYIFKELEKYYNLKTIQFFKKKVDTEYNMQLREMAFNHMQGFMHFVVLRRQKYMVIPSNNKKRREYLKKTYAYERFEIESIPEELEYRINNSKEQRIKQYDFFISHSSSNFNEVQSLVHALNNQNKNVYCDWINDTDYLKRHLVSSATKNIIEKRLEQSQNIILVKSKDAVKSKWVKYELNYFHSLNRTIFEIDIENIKSGNYDYFKLKELWFVDVDFEKLELLN